MDAETLAGLRDAELAYLRQWLDSDEALEAWCEAASRVQAEMLARPLGELCDAKAVSEALAHLAGSDDARRAWRGAARELAREVMGRASARPETPARLLGEAAMDKIEALFARPEVVSERLLGAMMADPAVESVMRDVLYDALVQFNQKVNPFYAEWGLPALLDQLPLFGKGAMRKALEGMRRDFDKRLEPEIGRFLEGFSRRALDRALKRMIDRGGDPELTALRRHAVRAIAEQPLSELCPRPDSEHGALAVEALTEATVALLDQPLLRREIDEALAAELADHRSSTVAQWLEVHGLEPIELAPLARATWPVVRAALASDPVSELVGRLLDAAHRRWLTKEQDGKVS